MKQNLVFYKNKKKNVYEQLERIVVATKMCPFNFLFVRHIKRRFSLILIENANRCVTIDMPTASIPAIAYMHTSLSLMTFARLHHI